MRMRRDKYHAHSLEIRMNLSSITIIFLTIYSIIFVMCELQENLYRLTDRQTDRQTRARKYIRRSLCKTDKAIRNFEIRKQILQSAKCNTRLLNLP